MLFPKTSTKRNVYSLDGVWKFKILTEEYDPAKPLTDGKPMAVPASYNDITTDKAAVNHVGEVAYERYFSVPVTAGTIYRLRIGSPSHKCRIFLNGKLVGCGINGYLPADCLLENLQPENRLSVVIDNRLTFQTLPVGKIVDGKQIINHDFYNFTGIHRSVCVYTLPEKHIDDITICTVVDNDYSKVSVKLDGDATNATFTVKDAQGNVVLQSKDATFSIPDVRLWSPKHPYLYTLKVETATDCYEERFGVRKVQVQGLKILLNDEPVYFTGFGMHEDFFILGKGNNTAVNLRNFELLKWVGANSARTSHYPYGEEFMDLADEYGIMVIDEVPAVGMNWWHDNFTPDRINDETLKLHNQLISDLMARDKNHPCVVMVSVANEAGTHEDAARDYFAKVVEHTRTVTDLPVTIVEFTKFDDGCKVGDLVDVIGLNRYYGWYTDHGDLSVVADQLKTEIDKFIQGFGKPIIVTEYGADTIEGLHATPSETFSEEFQMEYMAECSKAFDACEGCVGEQVWNFADFKTKQGLTRIRGNRKGVFTKERQPKMAAHFLKDRWQKMLGE